MIKKYPFFPCLVGLGILATSALTTLSAQERQAITNNTPKFVASATNLGSVDASTIIDVSIWLKPHNKAALDALAHSLYDRDSPQYHHWLTKASFVANYAPTEAEANSIKNFLKSNNLAIVSVGPDNFYVRASGTVAAVSSAFHVTLNNYQVNGKTIRANAEDPSVSAEVAPLVNSISGLDSLEYTHPYISQLALGQSLPTPPGASSVTTSAVTDASSSSSLSFNSVCFTGTTTETFTTAGGLPKATYTGNEYTNSNTGCGYVPSNIRAAYNLNPLYSNGLDGTGQTIVIIDWCGSPTIKSDANAFSAQFGLPKLTSANFKIINTPTPSQCAAPDPEINIDVEWSHAIAPGAAIDLVVPPSATFQDVDEGFFYAVDYQLGNVISGSYGSEELYTPSTVLTTEDLISETAAVLGISANFSSGDGGDFTFDAPQYNPASVSAPADSPYATAVGGISLALTSSNTIAWQSGWGTNETELSDAGYVYDPPTEYQYFNFGSGGGESAFFAKPLFQNNLPGAGRQLPDVSWLADPFTGAYIAISEPFTTPELTYQVYGGTSLACPMFSGLWAIANQAAGAPLGQAAPYLYNLPASAIIDIVPHSSKTNVTGVVKDSSGKTSYSAAELAEPLENTTTFESAIWNVPLYEDTAILITFGTDSGLTTGPGWDNVTGVGVPNGAAFVNAFKP
jgi:subtilase family serine protease